MLDRGAGLIAVGSELLRFGRRDTNGDWLADRLARLGIEVALRVSVEDEPGAIASVLRAALDRCAVVLVTGGLGPTEDDRTRDALAVALDRPLVRDPARADWLRERFAAYGRAFRAIQLKQADLPRGAAWIDNPIGSAAGILFENDRLLLAAMPGVPAEMRAMYEAEVAPRLARGARATLASRTLRVAGRTESSVDEQVRDLYVAPGLEVTILTGSEGIELRLRAEGSGPADTRRRLDAADRAFTERLGADLYGRDDETLASVVGALLARRGWRLAVAESCTAGLLAAEITRVPGSSGWFSGGMVVYGNQLKIDLAGVPALLIERDGAVSEPVARSLARAARERCSADLGIGITGIAGPGGGSEEKPVGLIHLGLADPVGESHWSFRMIGDRDLVRRRTVVVALDRLRRHLLAAVAP